MKTNNPYKVLGITAFTSEDEAKKRYRELSKLYHPDNPTTGDAEKFMEVDKAWKELQEYGFNSIDGLVFTHSSLFKIKQTRR